MQSQIALRLWLSCLLLARFLSWHYCTLLCSWHARVVEASPDLSRSVALQFSYCVRVLQGEYRRAQTLLDRCADGVLDCVTFADGMRTRRSSKVHFLIVLLCTFTVVMELISGQDRQVLKCWIVWWALSNQFLFYINSWESCPWLGTESVFDCPYAEGIFAMCVPIFQNPFSISECQVCTFVHWIRLLGLWRGSSTAGQWLSHDVCICLGMPCFVSVGYLLQPEMGFVLTGYGFT